MSYPVGRRAHIKSEYMLPYCDSKWRDGRDSNSQSTAWQAGASPLSYHPKVSHSHYCHWYKSRGLLCMLKLVVPVGLEPTMFIFSVKSRNQSPLWGRHHKFFQARCEFSYHHLASCNVHADFNSLFLLKIGGSPRYCPVFSRLRAQSITLYACDP